MNLSNPFLNPFILLASTTSCDKEFHTTIVHWGCWGSRGEENFFFTDFNLLPNYFSECPPVPVVWTAVKSHCLGTCFPPFRTLSGSSKLHFYGLISISYSVFTISHNNVIPYIHHLSQFFSVFTVTFLIQEIFLWQWMVLITNLSVFTRRVLKPNYLPWKYRHSYRKRKEKLHFALWWLHWLQFSNWALLRFMSNLLSATQGISWAPTYTYI